MATTKWILTTVILAASSFSMFAQTPRKPVTDEYYGIKVVDDYRWLDDMKDSAVNAWTGAQNRTTRAFLDGIPGRAAIETRLKQILEEKSSRYSSIVYRERLFALKYQPPKNQPFLVVMESPEEPNAERVVVDPNELDPAGTTAIDFYVPSRNGNLVAVSLSKNGSEDGTVYVFDVENGKQLPDIIPRVQFPTAGGDVEWNSDGTGFFHTRYPQGNERRKEDQDFYQQVYFHRLGTPAKEDAYVLGREFPRIAETRMSSSDDGQYVIASVANGDGGEFAHYLRAPSGEWAQITRFSDKVESVTFGMNHHLYLLSRTNASKGKILALPVTNPRLTEARTIIPESDASISGFIVTSNRIYVVEIVGGPSRIRTYNLSGKPLGPIPLRPISSVGGMVRLGGDDFLYGSQTYLDPLVWYRFNASTGASVKTPLSTTSSVDFSDAEVVREFAVSKDGTKVPMNIVRLKKTVLNGSNPTLLYGYGGFGISEVPEFDPVLRLWLDHGGVYVSANLRGGGEFGEDWHEAGRLTRKQNVFDDFAACAHYLIDTKYASASTLAIEGGSNGGLLMGAAFTQHPELFRAVVSHVGIYDMLRVELFPNGAFNITEFGSVKDPEQFKALFAYSPYHHVVDGTHYPAILFMTGDNDGRVDPANSRKMTARLQAASASGLPILLRTTSNAGHGIGTGLSERVAEETDVFSFLISQLKKTGL